MSECIVITSGKGGVGKTTTTANLGVGLALTGASVAVVDADIGLRNLDVILGLENRIVYDLVHVVEGQCRLKQALIKDKRIETLFVLAASQTRDKDALTADGVRRVLDELIAEGFEYVVCDSPAGIEKGAHLAMYFADRAIVVVNPDALQQAADLDRRFAQGGPTGPLHCIPAIVKDNFETIGLQAADQIFHAAGFELEHRCGFTALQQVVGRRVLQ